MSGTLLRLALQRHSATRLSRSHLMVAFLGFSLIFPMFWTTPVQAQQACLSGGDVCSRAYLDSLPNRRP